MVCVSCRAVSCVVFRVSAHARTSTSQQYSASSSTTSVTGTCRRCHHEPCRFPEPKHAGQTSSHGEVERVGFAGPLRPSTLQLTRLSSPSEGVQQPERARCPAKNKIVSSKGGVSRPFQMGERRCAATGVPFSPQQSIVVHSHGVRLQLERHLRVHEGLVSTSTCIENV